MRLVICSDHGAFKEKGLLIPFLNELGHIVCDVGTYSSESCDYPIYAKLAAEKVAKNEADFAILLCESGEGVAIAANKVRGVRAGIAYNDEVTKRMRSHNNCNAIAFGVQFMTLEDIKNRIKIFLETDFETGGRHERRVNQIEN